jgi:hypothetical protein
LVEVLLKFLQVRCEFSTELPLLIAHFQFLKDGLEIGVITLLHAAVQCPHPPDAVFLQCGQDALDVGDYLSCECL